MISFFALKEENLNNLLETKKSNKNITKELTLAINQGCWHRTDKYFSNVLQESFMKEKEQSKVCKMLCSN